MSAFTTAIAQIINWIVLGLVVLGTTVIVIRTGYKRGYSRGKIATWVVASLALFPIGFIVFLLIDKNRSRK